VLCVATGGAKPAQACEIIEREALHAIAAIGTGIRTVRFAAHTEYQGIEETIVQLAGTASSVRDWYVAVAARHPEGTRGELTRAAFRLAIALTDDNPKLAERALQLGLFQRRQ
jgi:hypothetical protein